MAKAELKEEIVEVEDDFDSEGLSDEEQAILRGEVETEGEEVVAPKDEAQGKLDLEPAEEKAEEPASDEKPPKGYVKHEAMYAERQKRQEIERKMRERDEILENLARRLEQTKGQPEQVKPQQDEEEEPVDFLTDPEMAYNQALKKIQRLEQGYQQVNQREEQQRQEAQRWQQQQQLEQSLVQEYNASLKEDPALDDAVNHVVDTIGREFDMLGYANSGVAREQYIRDTVLQHSMYARNTNTPIGQYMRHLAQARGWQESAPEEKDLGPSEGEKKVNSLQTAQKRTRSLSRGASGDSGETTLETLDKMTPAELEAFYAKNSELVDDLIRQAFDT